MSLNQCKVAWQTIISAMCVRIYQSNATLAELTDNEMFWKSHWAWHTGPAPSLSTSSGSSGQNDNERRLQSLLDKANSQLANRGAGRRGSRGTKKRGNGNNNGGNGGSGGNGGNGNGGNGKLNKPPPPPNGKRQGGGKPWGQKKKGRQ